MTPGCQCYPGTLPFSLWNLFGYQHIYRCFIPPLLTRFPLLMHIWVSVLGSISSGKGLLPLRCQAITGSQCWLFVNWTLRNKLQWNRNQNAQSFTHENALEQNRSSAKWQPFRPGVGVGGGGYEDKPNITYLRNLLGDPHIYHIGATGLVLVLGLCSANDRRRYLVTCL